MDLATVLISFCALLVSVLGLYFVRRDRASKRKAELLTKSSKLLIKSERLSNLHQIQADFFIEPLSNADYAGPEVAQAFQDMIDGKKNQLTEEPKKIYKMVLDNYKKIPMSQIDYMEHCIDSIEFAISGELDQLEEMVRR